ncbi:unnamed protein product [Polarella glacialis]|uniref:ATP-dependent transporter ycf16 n=1 Tax=Polarella glacialis TaxID=89957 RepID=A0A813DF89_POLGL|nr:unnamed protein product [Polarella glacialis]
MCRGTLLPGTAVSVVHGVLVVGARPLLLRRIIRTASSLALGDVFALVAVLWGEAVCQMWMKQLISDEPVVLVVAACAGLMSKRIPHIDEGPAPAGTLQAGSEAAVAETTLMGNDLVRTLENARVLFQLTSCVVQVIVGAIVLVYVVGSPAFFGMAVCALSVASTSIFSQINKHNDKRGRLLADLRIALLQQVLEGIRFIKLNAWEESYLQEQASMRSRETLELRRFRTLEMANVTLGRATPPIASMVTFVAMALLGQPMQAAEVFSALSIFLTLRLPLAVMPNCVQMLLSLDISFKRFRRQLERPLVVQQPEPESKAMASSLRDVELRWSMQGPPVLQSLSCDLRWGELVAVVGAVASGKSTLLSGMLGGLSPSKGTCFRCRERIAYVPQRPVIFSGTILENIRMQHPVDKSRLDEALEAAQFSRDLELMPHGLETEIGERGTTLSGGQQTRLNIARAFYHNPAFFIADDPLAAVDVHVSSAMFQALCCWQRGGDVGQFRALVMATNQLHLLSDFDKVLYLEGGRIAVDGSPSEVLAASSQHLQLAELLKSAQTAGAFACEEAGGKPQNPVLIIEPAAAPSSSGAAPPSASPAAGTDAKPGLLTVAGTGKLVMAEHRERGAISRSVPAQYLAAVGRPWTSVYCVCLFLSYSVLAATDWWLAFWLSDTRNQGNSEASLGYAGVYAALAIGHAIFMVLCNYAAAFAGAHASRKLHAECLRHVLQAPLSWFEETPSGRILSRFSADIGAVDLFLPATIDHTCQTVAMTLVVVAGLCVVIPWTSLFIVLVAPAYLRLDRLVNRSSREVKRVCNNSLSPVLTLMQEASASRMLLRVMEQDAWLHERLEVHLDVYNNASYISHSLLTFLRFQGSMIGICSSTIALFLLWGMPSLVDSAPGGQASIGLALTYSFVIPYFISYVSMFASFARMFFTSLERLLELKSERIPQELPWHLAHDPEVNWPSSGSIELRAVTLRYRPDLPPAVNGLTLSLAGGERLGICGRTGAGKSTIAVLLFRLVEIESGSVLIDGVDVKTLGLHALRSAVVAVPQDPFLFEGPMSRNLDPTGAHSPSRLVEALSSVGLNFDLTAEVGKGGGQLSAGQRQLVAIARATLSRGRIVVMDEPTANCDAQTDATLQQLVGGAFAGRTVLCIAHRLNTIMAYDRILVMEAGSAVELGTPSELLATPTTRFARMVGAQSQLTGTESPLGR